MYYLFVVSIISTIAVFLMRYQMKDKKDDTVRNCSEYIDPYGNYTIETHKYIYKMSRVNGRIFKKRKNIDEDYMMIYSSTDRKEFPKSVKGVRYDFITGKSTFIRSQS